MKDDRGRTHHVDVLVETALLDALGQCATEAELEFVHGDVVEDRVWAREVDVLEDARVERALHALKPSGYPPQSSEWRAEGCPRRGLLGDDADTQQSFFKRARRFDSDGFRMGREKFQAKAAKLPAMVLGGSNREAE